MGIQCLIFKTLRRAGVGSNDVNENGRVRTENGQALSFYRNNGKIIKTVSQLCWDSGK